MQEKKNKERESEGKQRWAQVLDFHLPNAAQLFSLWGELKAFFKFLAQHDFINKSLNDGRVYKPQRCFVWLFSSRKIEIWQSSLWQRTAVMNPGNVKTGVSRHLLTVVKLCLWVLMRRLTWTDWRGRLLPDGRPRLRSAYTCNYRCGRHITQWNNFIYSHWNANHPTFIIYTRYTQLCFSISKISHKSIERIR